MKKLTLILQLLMFFFYCNTYSQFFTLYNYNDEQNIASNLTKALVVDSKGFVWVGTDAGLSRFDGKNFINVYEDFPSFYVKDVIISNNNKLIVATDLGVGYIEGRGNKYVYKEIINSNQYSKLSYPKDIFMDSKNNLWIGERDGIGKVTNGEYVKYYFPPEFSTDDYQHSFIIIENYNGEIFATSWQGAIFKYDSSNDSFVELKHNFGKKQFYINHLHVDKDNSIIAATSYGLVRFIVRDDKNVDVKVLVNLNNCMTFEFNQQGKFYIGTNDAGLFFWDSNSDFLVKMQELNKVTVINEINIDKNENIWVCSDEGVFLLKKTFFTQFVLNRNPFANNNAYIKTLQNDLNGDIYFTDQENIYKIVDEKRGKYDIMFLSKAKRVYTFAVREGIIWVSTRTGELIKVINKKSQKFSDSNIKGRLTSLFVDSKNNLWGYEEDYGYLVKIDSHNRLTKYQIEPYNLIEPIIKEFNNRIYIVCNKNKLSIFEYDWQKDLIVDKKYSLNFHTTNEFIINDFGLDENGVLSIMTNNGVYAVKGNKIIEISRQINGEPFNTKAILKDKDNRVWVGTEHGVILKDGDEFAMFTKGDGLPNNVITPKGLAMDKTGRLWVATSSGLAYWQLDRLMIKRTPTPIIYSVRRKHKELLTQSNYIFVKGKVDLKFQYAALVFPNKVEYKYRLLGVNDNWSEITTAEIQSFNNLAEGEYKFQIIAQQSGYLWSEVTEVKISVYPPWYQSNLMIVLYFIIGLLIVVYVTMFIQKRRIIKLEQQKRKLMAVVEQKVADLKKEKETTEKLLNETADSNIKLGKMNAELVKANEFKSDILSIAAHDLKNPLSTILNLIQLIKDEKIDNPDLMEMIEIIHTSSIRMMALIGELLESIIVENTKFKLSVSEFSLSSLVKTIVTENQIKASKKNQTIECNCDKDVKIEADSKWVSEIIDNVVNNAVKYSPKDKKIVVEITELNDKVQIKVKDEGPGFTKEDKEKIFNKFQKLSARPTGGESSTGLGLAIVKELVDLHKGTIKVESVEGEGACFFIELYKKLELN